MSQIDQFDSPQTASVDDFLESATKVPVTSAGSNQNQAAHAAMLSADPNDIPNAYSQIKDELDTSAQSQTSDAIIANAKGQNLMAYRRAAADLLTDPKSTDEYKLAALNAINSEDSGLFRARAMVATHAAEKPAPDETQEAADLRGVWAAGINNVLNFQREKQKYYNEMQLRQDANKVAPYVSFAEDLIPTVGGYKAASIANDLQDGGGISPIWGTVLPGMAKAKLRDSFNSIPYEERGRVMSKAMDIIGQGGSTIFLPEEYDNANMQVFREMAESDAYDATDETIDNIVGVLDVIGLGAILRSAGKIIKEGKAAEAVVEKSATQRSVERNFVKSDVQPTTPSQVMKDANPSSARKLHDAVEQDGTEATANALYGTSRPDAIAHDISPQVGSVDGGVQAKLHHPEQDSDFRFMPDADLLDFVENSGASYLAPSEKRKLRSSVVNDFRNAVGLVNRKEMGSVEALEDGVRFSSVYGPTDTGWGDLKEAVHQAKYALRDYGITTDEIQFLTRVGDEYHPISKEAKDALLNANNPQLKGDWLMQINHEYKFDTANLERDGFEAFDVFYNVFDRWFPGGGKSGQGTIQSNILDPQSMLHPNFTKGATISGLRGAQMEQKLMATVEPYVKAVKGMSSDRQQKLFGKIREANAKGENFNYANLQAEGFKSTEIKALEQWKSAQDTLYSLSNADLVKTYRTRGYGLMEHEETGTRLLVKELPRNQVASDTKVFDPINNEVRTLSGDEITALYSRNGNVVKAANPLTVDGATVEHVINVNAANSTYVRSLKSTDTILNYRKGYYAVRYQNPHFIEKKIVDEQGKPILGAGGQEQWRAVATAANIPDAQRGVERLTSTTGGEYRFRGDLKGEDFEVAESQRLQSGGMSSQRVRGQRLEEAVGQSELSEATNIESPINSLVHSVSAVSRRVSHRDWIETSKQRFLAQYSDVLPEVRGQIQYPRTRAEIGKPGQKTSKMAADARTTWEYIRQMENGYINSIDDGWKAMMNGVADILGTRGFGKAEEAARGIGGAGPTTLAKSTAFNLMLATNPLRQLLVQSHQILMLGATFPRYTFTHLADDLLLMMVHAQGGKPDKLLLKAAGRTEGEAKAMWDALKSSGISAGISKHEMVRESLNTIADGAAASRLGLSGISRVTAPIRSAVAASRKVGFDFGEWLSSSSSFMAHYDEAVRAGKKIDKAEIDNITSKSRNYVYNMDQAGAMPYNHNSVALITQFMQVPHKALLQFTFNRNLSGKEKRKIATYMAMMFGPGSIIGLAPGLNNAFEAYLNELLPNEPEWREGLINGVESLFLNKLFTRLYGEKVSLDYSSLSPLDAYGMFEFMSNILEEGPAQVVASSPAGSLLFGTNPRLMTLATTMTRFVGLGKSEYETDPVKWSNLALDVANLSSGFSNAYKAAYAWEYGRKIGALGGTTDSRVNKFEAIAQALGIPTQDESNTRKILEATWKNDQQMEKDVKSVFQVLARQLTQDGITPEQFTYYTEMSKMAMGAFKGNPKAIEVWNGEMRKQVTNKDYRVINAIMEQCGFAKPEQVKRLINMAPNLTQEQRSELHKVCDFNLEYREDLKENK